MGDWEKGLKQIVVKEVRTNMEIGKNRNSFRIGVILMLLSATMTCCGQLCWKMGAIYVSGKLAFYVGGFCLYAVGALLMIVAFRYGEMSVLHPMLSVGFVCSLFLGYFYFNEEITMRKVLGIVFILVGLCLLNYRGKREKDWSKK